jgi:hypothetical protein
MDKKITESAKNFGKFLIKCSELYSKSKPTKHYQFNISRFKTKIDKTMSKHEKATTGLAHVIKMCEQMGYMEHFTEECKPFVTACITEEINKEVASDLIGLFMRIDYKN